MKWNVLFICKIYWNFTAISSNTYILLQETYKLPTLMSLIFAGIKFRGWLDTFLIFAGI